MNGQSDLLYRFATDGVLAAPNEHNCRDAAHQEAVTVNSEHLVDQLTTAFVGMAHWARVHDHLLLE